MKYIKSFTDFVNESEVNNEDNNEEVFEGKLADIESEIASINSTLDKEGEITETDLKRLKKLTSRIDKYVTMKETCQKELEELETKLHELAEQSKAATDKIKSNTESLKANHKGGGFSFGGLMDANKALFATIEACNNEMKDINKKRDRVYSKIESI